LWIFGNLGKLAFIFVKKESEKTIKNLTIAFGETKNAEEIKLMAKQVYVNLALAFADYLHTINYITSKQFSKIIDFEGVEHLDEAYDEGKGVICMTGHVSSWEFSAIMPPVLGYETSASSKKMANARIDKLIVSYRQKRGMKNISRGNTYLQLIEVLNKGECLIVMTDQDAATKGVFIDFLGKSAYTPIGIARLALDSKSPVVPMFMIRKPDKRYCFKIFPPLQLIETGNYENDLLENTKIHSQIYEKIISEHPTQWVWMHERWKTTPEDVQRFLEKKRLEKEKNLT
jgi:KDO2-lipid IV(A) lauroyltransferase